jgi:hypothetical protein
VRLRAVGAPERVGAARAFRTGRGDIPSTATMRLAKHDREQLAICTTHVCKPLERQPASTRLQFLHRTASVRYACEP